MLIIVSGIVVPHDDRIDFNYNYDTLFVVCYVSLMLNAFDQIL